MTARTFGWLVLLAGVAVIASCGFNQPAATKARLPSPPPQPLVFYDPTGDPSGWATVLSELELREITDWVSTQTADPIWLVRVKPSWHSGKRGTIIAYLVPNDTMPRIRTGRAYYVPRSKERTGIHTPWEYAQVSIPYHKFAEGFIRPSLPELPFEWPAIADPNAATRSPMSKEEVIAIVDFVRQPSSYGELSAQDGAPAYNMVRGILDSPIYQIARKGNDINVRFGFMHGSLWGYGLFVTLEHSLIGYKVKAWGSWIS